MKILVVSHHLPPTYKSGAELYALRQALWLKNRGHEVSAVAVEDIEAPLAQLQARAETYLGLEVTRLHFNRLNYPNPLKVSHNNPEIAAWLEQHLQKLKPDLMLVNACYLLGVGILEAARKARVPVVLTLHDFWFLCQRLTLMRPDGTLCDGKVTAADCALCISKDSRKYLWADKMTAGLAGKVLVSGANAGLEPFIRLLGGKGKLDTLSQRRSNLLEALKGVEVIIAPSRYLKQVFVDNGFPEDKIHYCRYGLDTERLASIEQQRNKADSNKSKGLRVGYLGQILPHKGVDIAIKAFRQVEDENARLDIYGVMGRDPKYDARLKTLAAGDNRISFAGPYAADELPGILSRLDTVVVPSIWLENSPLVIMEAQAAGIPVITTNLGGMAEMVEHGRNGLLFARKDANDLALQLRRLIQEPGLIDRLRAGIAPVKSLDQEFSELLPMYEGLSGVKG